MTLAREYPEDPATLPALRAGLRDTFEEIRLRAAQMLGAEGEPVLLELSQLFGRDDDDVAGRAIAALGERFGLERAHTLLAHALRVRRPHTAKACMAVLGHAGGTEALQMLARVLAVEKGELAEAAALALGSSRRGSVEAVLIGALDHEQGFVCQAAAQALGRVGSPAAVLPLKEMEAAHPRDPDVRRAAREAVAAIQARTGGAGPGQLSIADGEPGQVSYPTAEAGRVSLPDGKERTTP
jgi:HEAT repeat protein